MDCEYMEHDYKELIGRTFHKVYQKSRDEYGERRESICFIHEDGTGYRFIAPDTYSHVSIEDISGDLSNLEGVPILSAYENVHEDNNNGSNTWTFYNFATEKGYVNIRWYGTSNGYYSESVDFEDFKEEDTDGETVL